MYQCLGENGPFTLQISEVGLLLLLRGPPPYARLCFSTGVRPFFRGLGGARISFLPFGLPIGIHWPPLRSYYHILLGIDLLTD